MPSFVFNKQKAQGASNNWETAADLHLALVLTGGAPDPDDDTMAAALPTGEEPATGGGYDRAARPALANSAVIEDDANDEAKYDADDVVFPSANFGTVIGGIVYKGTDDRADDATNVPIAYCELASPVTTNGGDFTFQFGADGCFKAT